MIGYPLKLGGWSCFVRECGGLLGCCEISLALQNFFPYRSCPPQDRFKHRKICLPEICSYGVGSYLCQSSQTRCTKSFQMYNHLYNCNFIDLSIWYARSFTSLSEIEQS